MKPYLFFEKYFDLVSNHGAILEIGNGPDTSTHFLYDLAIKNNLRLYTVDLDHQKINDSRNKFDSYNGFDAFTQSGKDFLHDAFNYSDDNFSLIYLDNFDWDYGWKYPEHHINQQRTDYKNNYNLDLSNLNSQLCHLEQCSILLNKHLLTKQCLIIFDDTWENPDGTFNGKGGASIPFLLMNNFKILEKGPSSTWNPPWEFESEPYIVMGRV